MNGSVMLDQFKWMAVTTPSDNATGTHPLSISSMARGLSLSHTYTRKIIICNMLNVIITHNTTSSHTHKLINFSLPPNLIYNDFLIRYDLELHMVHVDTSNKISVVHAQFYQIGEPDSFLSKVMKPRINPILVLHTI